MENKKSTNKVHVKINDIDSTSQGLSEKERARKRERKREKREREQAIESKGATLRGSVRGRGTSHRGSPDDSR